jgi:hypothetical protein
VRHEKKLVSSVKGHEVGTAPLAREQRAQPRMGENAGKKAVAEEFVLQPALVLDCYVRESRRHSGRK